MGQLIDAAKDEFDKMVSDYVNNMLNEPDTPKDPQDNTTTTQVLPVHVKYPTKGVRLLV